MSLIYRDFDEVKVSNTVVSTQIANFDFEEFMLLKGSQNQGLFGPNQAVKLTIAGLFNQNVGAGTPQITFHPFLDARGLGDFVIDVPVGFPSFALEYVFLIKPGKNDMWFIRKAYVGDTLLNTGDDRLGVAAVPDATDLVANNNFLLNAEMSVASANFEVTKQLMMVQFL